MCLEKGGDIWNNDYYYDLRNLSYNFRIINAVLGTQEINLYQRNLTGFHILKSFLQKIYKYYHSLVQGFNGIRRNYVKFFITHSIICLILE